MILKAVLCPRKARKTQNISAYYTEITVGRAVRALASKARTARPTAENESLVLLSSNIFVFFVPFVDNIIFR